MLKEWEVEPAVLSAGPKGAFDETAVKDPSVVRYGGKWHVLYTARGRGGYTTGYVAARTWSGLSKAPRHVLSAIHGKTTYGCAPQVFYFGPQGLWYLIFQTNDTNYQPAYSTTAHLDDPLSWTAPQALLAKDEKAKWIDFWTICDAENAYLFYTRDHRDVMVRKTSLKAFPHGWEAAAVAFTGVHEAVHVYKARGREEYHMFYELDDGPRSFGFAHAAHLSGPWQRVTDEYATGSMLRAGPASHWTDMVSHGEILRTGVDERLEYDDTHPCWLIQGLLKEEYREPYPEMPWKLGLMKRK